MCQTHQYVQVQIPACYVHLAVVFPYLQKYKLCQIFYYIYEHKYAGYGSIQVNQIQSVPFLLCAFR